MKLFRDMQLSESIIKALDALKITIPTEIQEKAIPAALAGKDIIASAQTGTGKTLAYLIPVVEYLKKNPTKTTLILVPTRELGIQVVSVSKALCSEIKSALLIGGEPFGKQLRDLSGARIIVGTPGRVIDHLERRTLRLDLMQILVFDEMDRMFDEGFAPQVETILKSVTNKKVQKLLFSATVPANILHITENILFNPERITTQISNQLTAVETVTQEVLHVKNTEKYSVLLTQLETRSKDGAIIIFVKTKIGAKKLAEKLTFDAFPAFLIHGDLRQHVRTRVIAEFRKRIKGISILVATSVAARGLDIQNINHVINYDLPQTVEEYVHRIGRTGRGGRPGQAIALVGQEDRKIWKQIERIVINKMDPANEVPLAKPTFQKKRSSSFYRGNNDSRGSDSRGHGGNRDRGNSSNYRGNNDRRNNSEGNDRSTTRSSGSRERYQRA